jgi:hypothetical protein
MLAFFRFWRDVRAGHAMIVPSFQWDDDFLGFRPPWRTGRLLPNVLWAKLSTEFFGPRHALLLCPFRGSARAPPRIMTPMEGFLVFGFFSM